MYFKSREAAGKLLATQLAKKYSDQKCAIVALSDGGAVVGAQIALKLRCVLTLLVTAPISLPREESKPVGAVTHDGSFAFNNAYSQPDIDAMMSEYRTYIEQEKIQRINEMHRASGEGDVIRRELLENKTIILVSDGLQDGFGVDLAFEFLKPIPSNKIIIATPFANVPAVDRMHVLADEIFCINVIEDFFTIDHYYDTPELPPHELVIKTVERVVSSWKS